MVQSGAVADMVKEKPAKEKENREPVDKRSMADKSIKDFIGYVKNLHQICIHNVFGDRYRVNVWTVVRRAESVCDTYNISQSYFMKFADGELTDLTIEPKEDTKLW